MSAISKLRRIGRWTAGAFTALIVLVVVGLFLLDLSRFSAQIEAAASETLQRQVTIAGEIRLTPSLRPSFLVKDVRIANPSWARAPELMQIQELELVVALSKLLAGSIDIQSVRASGFQLSLETGPEGQRSWAFDESVDAIVPPVGTLSVNDGKLSYVEAGWDSPLHLDITTLQGELRGDRPLSLSGRLLLKDRPLSLQVDGGTLAALAEPTAPWPLRVTADAEHMSVSIDGTIADPRTLAGVDLQLAFTSDEFGRIGEPFGVALPTLGAVQVQARVTDGPAELRLSELAATLAENSLTGQFAFYTGGARPRLRGEVHADRLQLEVLGALPYATTVSFESEASRAALFELPLDLPALDVIDMELSSSIEAVLAGERNLGTRTASITLKSSALTVDVRAGREEDASVQLHLGMDGTGDALDFTLELTGEDVPYGEVLERWQLAEAVSGTAEHVQLRVQGKGTTVRHLFETANVDLAVKNTGFVYPRWSWSRTPTTIASASLAARQGRIESLQANGTRDEQTFEVSVSGSSIDVLDIEKPWPIDLSASLGDHRLSAKGTVTRLWREHEVDLAATLSGRVTVPAARMVDDRGLAVIPYALSGRLIGDTSGHRLDKLRGEVGASEFSGALTVDDRARGGYKLSGELHSQTLAIEQISAVLFAAEREARADAPIELRFLHDNEFDLKLSAHKASETPLPVSELRAHLIAGDGRLIIEPLGLRVAELPLSGKATLDATGPVPSVSFALTTEGPVAEALHPSLGRDKGPRLGVGALHVTGQADGTSWAALWQKLALDLDARRVQLVFRDDESTGTVLDLDSAEAHARPGAPTQITAQGRYREVPFHLDATTAAVNSAQPQTDWPVVLRVEAQDTTLEVEGTLGARLDATTPNVRWSLRGEHTQTLERLLGLAPVELGAYRVSGELASIPEGYELRALDAELEQSDLTGQVQINTESEPVEIRADLRSSFLDVDRLMRAPQTASAPGSATGRMIANPTLFPAHSANFHAQVQLGMERVVIAGFEVHDASVAAQIEHGQLTVGKHQGTFSTGGSFEFHHRMVEEGTQVAFRAYPLNLGGMFQEGEDGPVTATWPADIDIELTGQGVTLHELLTSSDGHISFTAGALEGTNAYIERIRTGLLEIMFPRLRGERARLNCLAADFSVDNGVAKTENAVYDTSSATVFISGTVNLESEALELTLVPRPKRPGLFDVATPVQVSNTLVEPQFSVAPGDVALKASALPFTAPLRLPMLSKLVSAKGDERDPCVAALKERDATSAP